MATEVARRSCRVHRVADLGVRNEQVYPWLILSAKHGLLEPEQTIAPYDVALSHLDGLPVSTVQARLASLRRQRART